MAGMGHAEPPWDDCKVAFGVGNPDTWDLLFVPIPSSAELSEMAKRRLPSGWTPDERDTSGARVVIVFRVVGVPDGASGRAVRELLDELEREPTDDEVRVLRAADQNPKLRTLRRAVGPLVARLPSLLLGLVERGLLRPGGRGLHRYYALTAAGEAVIT